MATTDFKIIIHYPTEENQEEFDRRSAQAVAKVLVDSLPSEKIDELIETYNNLSNEK